MDKTQRLLEAIEAAAADKKAEDVVVIDVAKKIGITDYFVICTAFSAPQTRAIVEEMEKRAREATGSRVRHVEGNHRSEWVLMDFGDVVVHIFSRDARLYYSLEKYWGLNRKAEIEIGNYGESAGEPEPES